MIYFQCPTCRKDLKAQDGFAGRKVECPDCGQRLLIPPPEQATGDTVLGLRVPNPEIPANTPKPVARKSAPAPSSTNAAGATGGRLAAKLAVGFWIFCCIIALSVLLVVLIGAVMDKVTKQGAAGGPIPEMESPAGPLPEMEFPAYVVQRPAYGARVTADCRLQQNSNGLLGVRLFSDLRWETAFVRYRAPAAEDVWEALKDGKEHKLTLEIRPMTAADGITGTNIFGRKVSEASIIIRVIDDTSPIKDTGREPADMTLAAFFAQRPEKPTKLALRCRLDNFRSREYQGTANTHYSIQVFEDGNFWGGHAHVRKDSEVGRRIFERLKDGKEHRLTIEVVLQGPDGNPTPADSQGMAITEVWD